MKRVLPLFLALLSVLVWAPAAQASLLQGGYDEATRQLEAGFKIVATQRIASDNECYPAPGEIASALRQQMGIEVTVAPSLDAVQGFGLVNVISGETECNRLVLAIRAGAKGRVFILDSDYGPVYVQGGQGLSEAAAAQGIGPLRDLAAATSAFRMRRTDQTDRLVVNCPAGTSPLGGGMLNATPIGPRGQGVYPHSYERLGVQGGFHVTATLIDPTRSQSSRHRGVLQVLCGRGLVPTASPHQTVFVRRHGTGTVTARCPHGMQLFSGGFQRTNFTTPGISYNGIFYGGDYITESRAVGNAWRVSAGAVDSGGGELTAIAYCGQDRSLPVSTVSSTAHVGHGDSASATTPRCPAGRALIAGGFDFGGSHDALFASGYFTRSGAWAATGYGWFGAADLTAYGYCAKVRDTVDRRAFPKAPPPGPAATADDGGGHFLLYVALGALGLVIAALFLRRRQVVRRRAARR